MGLRICNVIDSLEEFKPWSGAKYTYNRIVDADKGEEFIDMLSYEYPDGMTEMELNDLLWFDGEYCLGLVGLDESEEE